MRQCALVFLFLPLLVSPGFAQIQSSRPDSLVAHSDTLRHPPRPIIVTGFPNPEGRTPAPAEHVEEHTIKSLSASQDIPKILSFTPSALYYNTSGTDLGYSYLNLRGFDQSRIAVMVNGIPQNGPEDGQVYWIDMPELAASTSGVAIQRGGGTAYYGPPAIGGSVNVETELSPIRSFDFKAGYGDFNTHTYSASANSGLIDGKYEVYARLSQLQTDGYRDFSSIEMNSYFLSVARYDSNLTLKANFYGGPFTDGLYYYGITRHQLASPDSLRYNPSETFTYERRPDEREHFSQPHYELLSDWRISPSLSLSNTIFYIQGDGYFDIDGTWPYGPNGPVRASFFRLTQPYASRYGFTAISDLDTAFSHQLYEGFVGNKQWGWLPQLTIRHPEGSLTIAAELRTHRSDHWGRLLYAAKEPVDLPGDYHFYEFHGAKDIANLSLSEMYDASDNIHLLGSLQLCNMRYQVFDEKPLFFDSASAADRGIAAGWHSNEFSVPLTFLSPKVGIALNLTDAINGYANISYTTREPRLVDYYNGEFLSDPSFAVKDSQYDYTQPNVKPEHLLDIEGGISLLRQMLGVHSGASASIGGYYMRFNDEIVETGSLDHFGNAVQRNAARTEHYGVEVQGRLDVEDVLSVEANLTLSKNTILSGDTSFFNSISIAGNIPVGFTPVLGNLLVQLKPTSQLSLHLTGHYVGQMYGDISNSPESRNDPYFVMDGGVAFHFDDIIGLKNIEAAVQVNNLLDTKYAAYVTGEMFFVGAPRNFFGSLSIKL